MAPDRPVAVIFADGDVPERRALDAAWPDWDAARGFVVAADGGARHAAAYGLRVDVWVGDGDSIRESDLDALTTAGAEITRLAAEKDETDAEAALTVAIQRGAGTIVVLGALGGPRADHALANIGMLAHPALHARHVWLFDARCARLSLLVAGEETATCRLAGRVRDLVSLIPWGETAIGVTTTGLRYPLADEPLLLGQTRGVSNVRTAREATVTLRAGRLLVIETPVTVGA